MIGVIGKATLYARIGDVITANVKEASATGTVKKGEVVRAVLVRTRQPIRRDDGSFLRFDNNAIVIIDKDLNPRKGSSGKILEVIPRKQRVLIEGVRIIKKHLRKSQDNPQGKIAEREGPIHISNVKLIEREKKAEKKTKTKPKEVAEKKAA